MARGENQKLKLAYLTQIMLEKTYDEHALTMPQIIKELEKSAVISQSKNSNMPLY